MKPLALALVSASAWALFPICVAAEGPPVYVNNLSWEAARAMEKIAGRDPAKLKETEVREWARARLAWVALKRLQGQEKEALKIFEGCRDLCEKYGAEGEWASARDWGCAKKREAQPCLSSVELLKSVSPKKTKAQKPSR